MMIQFDSLWMLYSLPLVFGFFQALLPFLPAIGSGISKLVGHQAQNRQQGDLSRVEGQKAFESALMNRALLEESQRGAAERRAARLGYMRGFGSGSRPSNLPALDPDVMAGMESSGAQAMQRLRAPSRYGMDQLPELEQFQPSKPGFFERVGSFLGPGLEVGGTIYGSMPHRRRGYGSSYGEYPVEGME